MSDINDLVSTEEVATDTASLAESNNSTPVEENLAPGQGGDNPAWSDFLAELPSSLHQLAKPHLEKWDSSYRTLQEEYAPFKALPEDYRSPEKLNQAIQVFEQIGQDPYRVLQILAQNLGVSLEQAEQIVENQQEEEESNEVEEFQFTEEDDPRLQQLYEQNQLLQQQMEERFARMEQIEQDKINQAQEAQLGSEIDNKVRELLDAKKVDPSDLSDLMEFAFFASQNGSKDPIADAYKRLQGNIDRIAKRVQPKQDPLLFMPTNGAAPANTGGQPDISTESGRYALAKQIAETAARQ